MTAAPEIVAEWRAYGIDPIAVERACNGDRTVNLTRAEVAEAFTYLDGHGYSAAQIAARLGVAKRTVHRWRTNRNFPISRTSRRAPRVQDFRRGACPECGLEMLARCVSRHSARFHEGTQNGALTCDNGGATKRGPGSAGNAPGPLDQPHPVTAEGRGPWPAS